MSSAARAGRRRRLLHEGANNPATSTASGDPSTPGPKVRYTPRSGSVSFAFAAGLIPQTIKAIAGVVGCLAAVGAALLAVDAYGVAAATTGATAPGNAGVASLLMVDRPTSLAAWWMAALWLAVALLSVLLYGLRRHRTDDLRGGYRWWLAAGVLAVGLSVNAATHAHRVVAGLAASLVGWSPLPGDAFWWFAPATLVLGAIAVRMLLETKESPGATAVGVLAILAAAIGWSAEAGLTPQSLASVAPWAASPLVGPAGSLALVSLTALTLVLYSRRIVLEAAGDIAPPKPAAAPKPAPKPKREREEAPATLPMADDSAKASRPSAAERRAARKTAKAPVEAPEENEEPLPVEKKKETVWVSGGDGYQDEYDDAPRKLTKAERKRLRKQKARDAA